MQDDQAARDAATLIASLARNHPEAMRGTRMAQNGRWPRSRGGKMHHAR
jgi:hypothetical protein